MELFKMVLGSEVKKLHKNNVRLKIIGDTSRFDSKLVNQIRDAETLTEKNNSLVLNIAANYGGRWDIVNAAKELITQVQAGQIDVADIDEETFTRHTCAADLPAVDLLIRTGGEQRISNFLLWQIAYAELYFSEHFWPDFNEVVFQVAVDAFTDRQRRFGKTSEQVSQRLVIIKITVMRVVCAKTTNYHCAYSCPFGIVCHFVSTSIQLSNYDRDSDGLGCLGMVKHVGNDPHLY
jgi:undecaprenyl diphosphate synthase